MEIETLLASIASATVFDLEQPRTADMPVHPSHHPGYAYHLHRRHEDSYRTDPNGPRGGASGVIVCKEHSGTHIDALCHQSEDLKLHGGIAVDPRVQTMHGFSRLGVEEIPPLVGPGVLLDVARFFGVESLEPGYGVTTADLEACCERQGVSIRAGDVVLVRTGNARSWRDPERYLAGPGIAADASKWLAEQSPIAVGSDTMAWDVIGPRDPETGSDLPGHLIMLVRSGIYILENLDLETLAAEGHSRFLFVCAPLKLVGATGSPVRPIAIGPGRVE